MTNPVHMRQVELEAVRPGGDNSGEELRLSAAVLPLRLRVDQAVVEFLQGFFAPPNPDEGDGELINWADEEEDSDGLGDNVGLAEGEEADSGAARFSSPLGYFRGQPPVQQNAEHL